MKKIMVIGLLALSFNGLAHAGKSWQDPESLSRTTCCGSPNCNPIGWFQLTNYNVDQLEAHLGTGQSGDQLIFYSGTIDGQPVQGTQTLPICQNIPDPWLHVHIVGPDENYSYELGSMANGANFAYPPTKTPGQDMAAGGAREVAVGAGAGGNLQAP